MPRPRLAALAATASVLAAGAAAADCVLPAPTAAAGLWQLEGSEPHSYAARIGEIVVPLRMDSPDAPVLLDYFPLDETARVGLLRYFSGAPGTASLTPLQRTAIVDMAEGRLLGAPIASADCVPSDWDWTPGGVTVTHAWGSDTIALP